MAVTIGLQFFFVIIGGILPALFWLWFWLREDRLHPEPREKILFVFLAGMVAVPLIYPLQNIVYGVFGLTILTLFIFAAIEEIGKYIAAYVGGLHSKAFNEPVDALIYMITAALGFSALESILFLVSPIVSGDIGQFIAIGNMRFLGATLLHLVASSIVGYCIGREFFKGKRTKILWTLGGLTIATALHTVFNFFMTYQNNSTAFLIAGIILIGVITFTPVFTKIKKIKNV